MSTTIELVGVMVSFFIGGFIVGWILNDVKNNKRRRRY